MNVTIPYAPRPLQRVIHDSLKRFNVLVCHRRFGKTVLAINHTLKEALTCTKPDPRYAYVAPTYKQAKLIAWDYVKKFAGVIPGVNFNEQELRCDLPNGAKIRLLGADNPDSLRGIYLDGVVPDEPALMPPTLWPQVIRPLLEDRKGWALFIGTPKGHNQFYELHEKAKLEPDWYTAVFRASESGIFTQEQMDSLRRDMSQEEYEQEFECSFEAAIVGAYYGREMAQAEREGRITDVPWDPSVLVETWWDLGMDDSTVIWLVQRTPMQVRIIDVIANAGVGLAWYRKELQDRPYAYGRHIGPHDIEVRELGTGQSRKEVAAKLGIAFEVAPNLPVQDGIESARRMLAKCWFNGGNPSVRKAVEALKQYRREWNEKNGVFKGNPLHDWTSDYADAFRIGAVSDKPVNATVDYHSLYG